MKSDKGITLTSLIIYVIVFTTVIGTVTMITNYLKGNIDEVKISSNTQEQYTRFTTYLTDNLNSVNLYALTTDNDTINIQFTDGDIYRYKYINNKIYYIKEVADGVSNVEEKKIVLCNGISDYKFSYENDVLKVSVTINNITYNNSYTVK